MKKSKILVSSLLLAGAMAVAFGLAGCKSCSHQHTYSEDWSNDENNHWHAATCEHDDMKADEGAHEYDANYRCTVCGYQHVHTFDSDYVCTTCGYKPNDQGIVIVKEKTDYVLDSALTMDVPVNDLVVKMWKENGMTGRTLAASEYTLKFYKGEEELTDLTGVAEGAYNIWATAKVNGEDSETFVVVYVMDEVESIAFKNGKVEQSAGSSNEMSPTWTYTVTYKSGRVEEVAAEDVKVEGVVVNAPSEEDAKATVSYTYTNLKGEEQVVSCEVPYTVKSAGSATTQTYKFSADNLTLTTAKTTEDLVLVEGVMTAKPGIEVDGNKKEYKNDADPTQDRAYTQRLKLGGAGNPTKQSIEIKVTGKAKVVVYAVSGSSTEERKLVLAKSTYTSFTDTPEEIIDTDIMISGAALTRVEYEITEAGNYYLVSTKSGINIYGVEVEVEAPAAATSENVVIGSDQLTERDITAETEIVPGVSIIADADNKVTIDGNSKTFTNPDDATQSRSYSKRIKLGGTGSTTKRAIKIVTTGKAKIVIYAMSSSGSADRQLAINDGTTEDTNTMTCPGAALARHEFSVSEAGTYYLYSKDQGINIYGIEIIYD